MAEQQPVAPRVRLRQERAKVGEDVVDPRADGVAVGEEARAPVRRGGERRRALAPQEHRAADADGPRVHAEERLQVALDERGAERLGGVERPRLGQAERPPRRDELRARARADDLEPRRAAAAAVGADADALAVEAEVRQAALVQEARRVEQVADRPQRGVVGRVPTPLRVERRERRVRRVERVQVAHAGRAVGGRRLGREAPPVDAAQPRGRRLGRVRGEARRVLAPLLGPDRRVLRLEDQVAGVWRPGGGRRRPPRRCQRSRWARGAEQPGTEASPAHGQNA